MIDYRTKRYTTSEVAHAAGLTPSTLRNYLTRKQWRQIGRRAEGEGLPNLFSLRDALSYAIAAELVRLGAHPKPAFEATIELVHTGDENRKPGELPNINEEGETVLLFSPRDERAKMIAANRINGVSDLLRHGRGLILLVLNDVEQQVFAALDGKAGGA